MRCVEKATLLNSIKGEKLLQICVGSFFGAFVVLNCRPLPHKEQRIAVMVGKQFIWNILVQRIRTILEDPAHLAVQKIAKAWKHITDLRIMVQYTADKFAVLFCKVIDSVKEKIEHLIFRCMMVFRNSWQVSVNSKPQRLSSLGLWRRHPESNRGWRFCRPLPYRLAMAPYLILKRGRLKHI